jgi:predicted nucleic acid-binding protein
MSTSPRLKACAELSTTHRVPHVLRDPDDDYVVALASEAGADAIVSGDLDLREAVGLPVEVLTPRETLARLSE